MIPWLIAGLLGFMLLSEEQEKPSGVPPGIPPKGPFPPALPPFVPPTGPPGPPPGSVPMEPPGGLPEWPAVAPAWWPVGVPYPPVLPEFGDEFGPAKPAGWPAGVPFPPFFPLPGGIALPPQPPPGGPVPFAQVVPCDYYVVHDAASWFKVASAANLGDPFVRNAYEQTLKTWFTNVCGIPVAAQIGFNSPGNWYLLRQCGADLVLLGQCNVG